MNKLEESMTQIKLSDWHAGARHPPWCLVADEHLVGVLEKDGAVSP